MSNLKDKSNFSIISAELLMNEGYHASSVHCSYYGLFQTMKSTMKNFLDITYDKYDEDCRNSSANSHAYLINLVYENFKKKGYSKTDAQKLRRRILDLKEQREMADYDNIVTGDSDSDSAYTHSTKLIKEIQTTFKK